MPYTVVIVAYRKPGLTPLQFKHHYESKHVPLLRSLAGPHFPLSHTRHYIQRTTPASAPANTIDTTNARYPAVTFVGTAADFEYDAWAELVFESADAFQGFFGVMTAPEAAKQIGEDEELFIDRARTRIAAVDQVEVTRGSGVGG